MKSQWTLDYQKILLMKHCLNLLMHFAEKKVYINCIAFPSHICCMRLRKRTAATTTPLTSKSRPTRDVDSLFGIPIVKSSKRQDEHWKPYSPYYIGMQGYSKPEGKRNFKYLRVITHQMFHLQSCLSW